MKFYQCICKQILVITDTHSYFWPNIIDFIGKLTTKKCNICGYITTGNINRPKIFQKILNFFKPILKFKIFYEKKQLSYSVFKVKIYMEEGGILITH